MSGREIAPELPQRVEIGDDVAWQKVDGLVVMLALPTERYYRLDETASRMWEVLEDSADVATALAQLEAEYQVDPVTLRRDLHDLIVRLADAGVLRIATA